MNNHNIILSVAETVLWRELSTFLLCLDVSQNNILLMLALDSNIIRGNRSQDTEAEDSY